MDCPSYFFLHIIAYTIFGNLIWNVLKHKAWWISALAIVAGVNIVLMGQFCGDGAIFDEENN